MRKIRVAHIITRMCCGGAQENTFHSVRLANRDRFDVDLVSGPVPDRERSLEPVMADAGISLAHEPSLRRAPHPVHDAITLKRLTRRLRDGGYDIVHTHTSKAGILGRMAAKRAGVPIIVHTPHGHIFHGYFSNPVTRLFVALEERAARFTDRIVTLTDRGAEEHLAAGIGRSHQYETIFSGVDFAPFDRAVAEREHIRMALGISGENMLFGAVGRLEPVKGFRYFVGAAHRIHDRMPEARFIVVGAGSEEKALRRAAKPLGNAIGFLGYRDDVAALMAACDVLAVPSLNEGMGRVVIEAGAAYTPVVAARVGGLPEVVEDGETGVLVSPQDPEALAAALMELAKHENKRREMGHAARKKFVPRYSVENMVRRIEGLYETLLEEKGVTEKTQEAWRDAG